MQCWRVKGWALGLTVALMLSSTALVSAPPVGAASIGAQEDPCLFSEEAAAAGILWGHQDPPVERLRNFYFPTPILMAGGVALGDLTGNGLDDVYLTSTEGPNRLYLNRGGGAFVEAGAQVGLAAADQMSFSAVFFDYTGNGLLDLYVANFGANLLYRNNGDGTFAEVAAEAGVAGADDEPSLAVTVRDMNGNGLLDIFVANFGRFQERGPEEPGELNRLYRNNGDGTFTDVAERLGMTHARWSAAAAWGDVTGNGWPDLYVANDFQYPNVLYLNDGGLFEESDAPDVAVGRASMNAEFADMTGDGRLDIYVTNIFDPGVGRDWHGNNLLINGGDGIFTDLASQMGVADTGWGWSGIAFDATLDGQLELLVTNGMISWDHTDEEYIDYLVDSRATNTVAFPYGFRDAIGYFWSAISRLFTGRLPMSFPRYLMMDYHRRAAFGDLNMAGHQPYSFFERDAEAAEGLRFHDLAVERCMASAADGRGVGLADLDGNGSVDAVINTRQGPEYYVNQAAVLHPERQMVQVQLGDHAPNRLAVGARLELTLADGRVMVRENSAGSAYLSQASLRQTFGLGDADQGQLRVRWPDGTWEELGTVTAGTRLTVDRVAGERLETPVSPEFTGPHPLSAQDPGVWRPLLEGDAAAAGNNEGEE